DDNMFSSDLFLSRAEVRDIDRRAEANGLPTRVLMENAGRGVAEVVLRLGVRGPILICAGKGNNGGDGLVAGRPLPSCGARVRVLLFAAPADLAGAAAENWRALEAAHIASKIAWPFDETSVREELQQTGLVIDALFGIGLTSPLRPPFDRLVKMMNDNP